MGCGREVQDLVSREVWNRGSILGGMVEKHLYDVDVIHKVVIVFVVRDLGA